MPGPLRSAAPLPDGLDARFDAATLRLRFLADGLLATTLLPDGTPPPPPTGALDPDARWPGPSALDLAEDGDAVTLRTPALTIRLDRASGRVSAHTPDGRTVQADAAPVRWRSTPGERPTVSLSKALRSGERLLGLGDKAVGLDRRGHRLRMWNTDAYRFERGTDPLYKSVPFVLGLAEEDGRPLAYGLFVDTHAPATFDLGHTEPAVLTVEAEVGVLTTYLLHAETPLATAALFARLTGRTPMLPRWALGYHQCRYSYATETEVRAVARELRQRRIPCDALYFDIHYMDGYRVFTWDREAFPDPPGLIQDLHADGFTTVAIIDPGVKADCPDYPVLEQGLARDAFLTYPNGARYAGEVWPGVCHLPDFSRAEVRQWWGGLHEGLLASGLDGIWCDMNEPAVFVWKAGGEDYPQDSVPDPAGTAPGVLVHRNDGHPLTHRQAHNRYGSEMLRATYEGLRRLRPERRPFTITRAAYAGAQRYGTTWTGDNSSTWDHLRLGIEQCLSLGVSGMSFCGADVGGFLGEPSGELMARWTQAGALFPLFRNHSAEDSPRQEPWRFGAETERVCREAIELRYRLLPPLYTALHEAARDGLPMLRPLALVHPEDAAIREEDPLAFYLGPSLLAAPVVEPRQREARVYLPDAPGWFCFHTGARLAPRQWHTVPAPLDRLPLFVRAGSVLPLGPVVQSTAELVGQPLTLRVYPTAGAFSSLLYEDAGDGWDHESGAYYRCTFRGESTPEAVTLRPEVEGAFAPGWSRWDIEVYGLDAPPRAVASGDADVPFAWAGGVARFALPVSAGFALRR